MVFSPKWWQPGRAGPSSDATAVTLAEFHKSEIGKKLTNFNRYNSVITDIDKKWFVIFEHTINHLFFGYVHLPQLEY